MRTAIVSTVTLLTLGLFATLLAGCPDEKKPAADPAASAAATSTAAAPAEKAAEADGGSSGGW